MAKQSGFLPKIEARHQRELEEAELNTLRFTRQVMSDATAIALNDVLGLGADRIKKVLDAISENYSDIADLVNNDTDDQEYSWSALDRKLKQICGEYFVPFEERYSQ
jgi:hypothetical protein